MANTDTDLNVATFVTDWLSFEPASRVGGERHFAASSQLALQEFSEPFVGWLLIGLLAASTSSPRLLASLGAGPLEDLLSHHPHRFVPLAASEARLNAGIRSALRSTLLCHHEVPEALLERLEAAVPGFVRLPECGCEAGV